MNTRKLLSLIVAFVGLIASGCSTFNYEWQREARKPAPTNAITGAWEGRWISDVNGHSGRLRCLIAQGTNGVLDARFYATYKRVLHFGYTVPLQPRFAPNGTAFMGSADLGILAGGVYRYSGYATPTNFFSSYDSKYDRGTFVMERPAPR